jgi:hypothetical protein
LTRSWAPPKTQRDWERARRAAFVQDILSALTDREASLLPFEEVRSSLRLRDVRYLGLQEVPLDQIVGSVDRYQDFTRAFFPRQAIARDRWRHIAQLASVIDGRLPPVDLYKVGDAYFVRDGNHRVSVARQQKMPCIEAYVWEYQTPVSLAPDTSVDDLLHIAARAAFLEQTHAAQFLRDDMEIELSQPSGYDDLVDEIDVFQQHLSRVDECEVPFEDAVALWCAMSYTPIVEIIRQRQILDEFPGRTETDLYLWLCRNQQELGTRYGQDVLIEEAAEDLAERFGEKPSAGYQVKRTVERVAGGVEALGSRLVRGSVDRPEEDDAVVAGLLASIRQVAAVTPSYHFQGKTRSDWEAWHRTFCEQLWDLLGAGERPADGASGPLAEVEERAVVDGLWRELIWLDSGEGLRVPIYLLRPQTVEELLPAVVVFPGHGTIAQTAGLESSCQQANALELARAGFVTLSVEPRGFGRLGAVGHLQLDGMARLVGRTWTGLVVEDGRRAIDYLFTRPEVDPGRIGVAGLAAGGAAAMYLAALDDRVQAAVIYQVLDRYLHNALDEECCSCNDIPSILRHAEMGDVAALIAPRPALFVNARSGDNTNAGVRESFATVRHLYYLLDVPLKTRLIEPEGGYACFDNELAIGWLRRWLARSEKDREAT